jgi:predicted RND superfamily exporter protein
MFLPYRKWIISGAVLIALLGGFFLTKLSFIFDFEQFFPEGDPDLAFFRDFIEEFESDDNFLLLAIENEPSVFDSSFLESFHQLSLAMREVPHVEKVQSLTMMDYPIKTPFGISAIPIIHRKTPSRYDSDRRKVLNDKRFAGNMISEDATSMTIAIKTIEQIGLEDSHALIGGIYDKLEEAGIEDYHMLGRAYFTSEIVKIQGRELILVFFAAGILVIFILIVLFKRPIGVAVALASIGLALLYFMEVLGMMGAKLNAMSAFYPVLMLIVGTSDVIHIMSKYVDELKKGREKRDAMITTIRQIGMATLLTSATTAVGFASLMTSKVALIREFGMHSAIGVVIAYITTIIFTTSLLSMFTVEQIIKEDPSGQNVWDRLLGKSWPWVMKNQRSISLVTLVSVLLCLYGITLIDTNYTISGNLPKGAKVTEDFLYFEDQFSGFRPLEFAIFAQDDYEADDYEVVKEVSRLEDHLYTYPDIKSIVSQATLYKSLEQMSNSNRQDAFTFPSSKAKYKRYKRMLDRFPMEDNMVMISKDRKKTRISSRIGDIGAERIKEQGVEIDAWVEANIDPDIIKVKRTGTGLIVDKNSLYVRDSLLYGLGLALIIVSVLMGFLFKDLKMLFISLVPNIIPILFAAALLGYMGIDLEAGISIVFAIVFGIAVDDTIHFLSKYKLSRNAGMSVDDALAITFKETGKAIIFTTIILFFGFMIMLFSSHPPSQSIGLMISITLITALLYDLTILPVLIRKFLK